MKKVLVVIAAMMLASGAMLASVDGNNIVPEIDANTASSAVALLSGALMMLRRKR